MAPPDPLGQLDELSDAHGGAVTLRVTDLLDVFGNYNLSRREAIARAIEAHGIEVEPPLATAKRHYTVMLTRAGAEAAGHPPSITHWALTAAGAVVPWGEAEGIRWIDVEAEGHAVADVSGIAAEVAPGTAGLVQRLTSRDYRPAVHVVGDDGSIRTLSCFAVAPDEQTHEDPTDPDAPKTGRLTFWPLEMAAGPRFLITIRRTGERIAARHMRAHLRDADGTVQRCPVLAGRELQEELAARWRRSQGSGGDAGLHVLQWVIDGYLAALRVLEAWLRQWELQSVHAQRPPEKETLLTLRAMLAELESRVGYFEHPHGDDPATGWLPHVANAVQARHVLVLVRRVVRGIQRLEQRVGDHLDAVAALEDERRSRRVERVGFVLLFPALIAGVFGANTAVPGDGTWTGFVGMVVAMVVLTYGAYWLFLRARRRRA